MNKIPIEECKHGYLYRIDARNFSFGVYDEDSKGFVGIRVKFSETYLFTEYHWDTGEPFGTATPKEELEKFPGEVDEDSTELFDWLDQKREKYKSEE